MELGLTGAQTAGRSDVYLNPPGVVVSVLTFLFWGDKVVFFEFIMFLESVESGVTRVSRVQPGLSISAARIWCESSQLQARGPFSLCAFALVAF